MLVRNLLLNEPPHQQSTSFLTNNPLLSSPTIHFFFPHAFVQNEGGEVSVDMSLLNLALDILDDLSQEDDEVRS
jgi:hypothetical protein